ncbi:hypothetical protein HanIR_Chr17g0853641 [Helianthus annuus]|nr:hypothetical protein HanIR_Chr17g0853641 [Helianthus annuus]
MENHLNERDLVCVKVSNHPWWPSIIYQESLLSTDGKKVKSLATITMFDDLHFVEKEGGSNWAFDQNEDTSRLMYNLPRNTAQPTKTMLQFGCLNFQLTKIKPFRAQFQGVWRSNMSLEIMEHPHQAIYIYVVLAALRRLSPLHL